MDRTNWLQTLGANSKLNLSVNKQSGDTLKNGTRDPRPAVRSSLIFSNWPFACSARVALEIEWILRHPPPIRHLLLRLLHFDVFCFWRRLIPSRLVSESRQNNTDYAPPCDLSRRSLSIISSSPVPQGIVRPGTRLFHTFPFSLSLISSILFFKRHNIALQFPNKFLTHTLNYKMPFLNLYFYVLFCLVLVIFSLTCVPLPLFSDQFFSWEIELWTQCYSFEIYLLVIENDEDAWNELEFGRWV